MLTQTQHIWPAWLYYVDALKSNSCSKMVFKRTILFTRLLRSFIHIWMWLRVWENPAILTQKWKNNVISPLEIGYPIIQQSNVTKANLCRNLENLTTTCRIQTTKSYRMTGKRLKAIHYKNRITSLNCQAVRLTSITVFTGHHDARCEAVTLTVTRYWYCSCGSRAPPV